MSTNSKPDDSAENLKRQIAHATNLPTLPGVAMKILELAKDPDVGLAEVAEVMALDPAMTSKVLRMANSPLYSRQRKVDNVRKALLLFGLDGALTVALSFSVAQLLKNDQAGDGLDYPHFWRRSLTCAAAGSLIAKHTKVCKAENVFLAGLIQDIGMLGIDLLHPGFYAGIGEAQYHHEQLTACERERLGASHGDATAWMLERWNFPEAIIHMVRSSHTEGFSELADSDPESRVLYVATRLAEVWWRPDRESALGEFCEQAKLLLNLNKEDDIGLMEALPAEIMQLSEIMETDVGGAAMLSTVADEARELLMLRNLHSLHHAREMEQKTERLEREVSTDPLTGAGNRGLFDDTLATEFEAAAQHYWPLTLLLADLDHFKRINDGWGHQAGDAVLRETVRRIRQCIRDSDTLARYGGEEFGIILPGTAEEDACKVGERIAQRFRAEPVQVDDDTSIPVTISIGVATLERDAFAGPQDLLAAADHALYEAKKAGRDKVVAYRAKSAS